MRFLIIDDDSISRKVIRDLSAETDFLEPAGECASASEAVNLLNKSEVDLIFLDIEMPGMSGFDLLKTLPKPPQIILITSHPEFALESYQYEVTDYLLKPVLKPRFMQAVMKANEKQNKEISAHAKELYVKGNDGWFKINLNELFWIEACDNYVNIFTARQKYMVLSTMKNIEDKLPQNEFIRVHRSYIVAVDKIAKFDGELVKVGSEKLIPVSVSYKNRLLARLNIL